MKTLRRITVVLLAIALFAAAQDTASKTPPDEQSVRDAVERMTHAWGNNDPGPLEKLWSDDYTFTNPFGIFLTKSQRLKMMRSGVVKVEEYSIDQEHVRIYGEAAVVTYRSVERRLANGREIPSEHHLVLTVLIKKDGVWRAVAQQSTPVLVRPEGEPNTKADK